MSQFHEMAIEALELCSNEAAYELRTLTRPKSGAALRALSVAESMVAHIPRWPYLTSAAIFASFKVANIRDHRESIAIGIT